MTLREEIRKLAEKEWADIQNTEGNAEDEEYIRNIESAILAGIKLALEQEPSHETLLAGFDAIAEIPRQGTRRRHMQPIYRAMTAQLLKELEEKT